MNTFRQEVEMNQLITTDKISLPIINLYTYTISNTVITRGKKNSSIYLPCRKIYGLEF